ncbi:hypothetical protein PM082_024407 [Marasmius tenuissimus]|nr:hypothetical protein PM082_024407 [Marasmius tenuissimus]
MQQAKKTSEELPYHHSSPSPAASRVASSMSTNTVCNPRANAQAASSSNQTKALGASSRPPATSTPASCNAGVSKNTQPNTSVLSNTNPAPETVKAYLGKPSNSDLLAAT